MNLTQIPRMSLITVAGTQKTRGHPVFSLTLVTGERLSSLSLQAEIICQCCRRTEPEGRVNKRDGCKETEEEEWRTEGPINVLRQRQIHTLDRLWSLTPTQRNTVVRSQLSRCLRPSPSLAYSFPTDCFMAAAKRQGYDNLLSNADEDTANQTSLRHLGSLRLMFSVMLIKCTRIIHALLQDNPISFI